MRRLALAVLVAGPLLALSEGPPAMAADGEPQVLIASREADARRRRFQPQGWEELGLRFDARVEQRLGPVDNVFAAESNRQADMVSATELAAQVSTGPQPWQADLHAAGEVVRYRDHDALDHVNGRAGLRLRGEGWDRSWVEAGISWRRRNELPGDQVYTVAPFIPVAFDTWEAEGDALLRHGRWFVGFGATAAYLDYRDARGPYGRVEQDDRDRWEVETRSRAGFAPTRTLDLFVENRQQVVLYDRADYGLALDRVGDELSVGAAFDLTERLIGEISVGHMRVSFASSFIDPISRPVARAVLAWAPTPLTTLRLRVWRGLEQTMLPGYIAILADGGRIGIEHELLRNVILSGSYERTRRRFLGILTARDDQGAAWRLGAEWRWNACWYTGLSVDHDARDAGFGGRDFSRTRAVWRIGARL